MAASERSRSVLASFNRDASDFTSFSALSRSALHSLNFVSVPDPEISAILSVSSCIEPLASLRATSTVALAKLASLTSFSRGLREIVGSEDPNFGAVFSDDPPVIAPLPSTTDPSMVTILTPPMFFLATSKFSTRRVLLLTSRMAFSISSG